MEGNLRRGRSHRRHEGGGLRRLPGVQSGRGALVSRRPHVVRQHEVHIPLYSLNFTSPSVSRSTVWG